MLEQPYEAGSIPWLLFGALGILSWVIVWGAKWFREEWIQEKASHRSEMTMVREAHRQEVERITLGFEAALQRERQMAEEARARELETAQKMTDQMIDQAVSNQQVTAMLKGMMTDLARLSGKPTPPAGK